MKVCVRHWKVDNGGFWHHFLDFRRFPQARLLWGYDCIVELVRNPNPVVRRTNWQTVIEEAEGNQPVLVRELHVDIDRIFSRARQKLNWSWYHLVLYNCEHFANECMIGVRRSAQVRARSMQAFTSLSAGIGAGFLFTHPQTDLQTRMIALFLAFVCLVFGAIFARFVLRSRATIRRFRQRIEQRAAEARQAVQIAG